MSAVRFCPRPPMKSVSQSGFTCCAFSGLRADDTAFWRISRFVAGGGTRADRGDSIQAVGGVRAQKPADRRSPERPACVRSTRQIDEILPVLDYLRHHGHAARVFQRPALPDSTQLTSHDHVVSVLVRLDERVMVRLPRLHRHGRRHAVTGHSRPFLRTDVSPRRPGPSASGHCRGAASTAAA